MKLLEVRLPADSESGLGAISLRKLGQFVVLAGRNGAGKSRILRSLVRNISTPHPMPALGFSVAELPRQAAAWAAVLGETVTTHEDVAGLIARNVGPPHVASVAAAWDSVRLSRIEEFRFVSLSPAATEITDVRTLSAIDIETHSKAAASASIDQLRAQALSRIQDLQNQWFNAGHGAVDASEAERAQAVAEYERLQSVIEALLGVRLGRDLRGNVTIFGRVVGEAALSEGQKILLLWSVMLHSQVTHLSQAVIICDEPENHLHPQALLDAIERISRALPDVQLWIATHSLPLLSHFDPSSIFWVEDGRVEFAGTKPLKVLRGLLGNDARIGRLHDFLGLPAHLAANRFASQCLLEPDVSDRGEGDPQTGQVRRLLDAIRPGQRLHVLDFGAGRGRLAAAIAAAQTAVTPEMSRIDYVAFEPSTAHHEELAERISELHGSATDRLFSDLGSLTDARGVRSFDVLVLCNVLHEIPVQHWLAYFGADGRFADLLNDNGYLLIVEDTLLPVGESPHLGGFLVLESTALYQFLACRPEELTRDEAVSNPRLLAHLIPKALVGRPTGASRTEALKQVVKVSGERIEQLRTAASNPQDLDGHERYRLGREHAFYVHQFTNATLALRSV